MSKTLVGYFNKEAAQSYDDKNSKLAPISNCLHFLMALFLKDLPTHSRVLSVGVGTGAEILFLSKLFPHWTFVALDPSSAMLDVCKKRAEDAGILDRCEFVHGYVNDLPKQDRYDAALSILVAHFIGRADRPEFFQNISERLRSGAFFVNAEISFDLDSKEFPSMLENWKEIQTLMGATPESLSMLPKLLKETLCVLAPHKTENLIALSGIKNPLRFFQASMISAWSAVKD